MNRTLAEQIIGFAGEPLINQELIKKYFRKKASEIHPDKFATEHDKLKATQRFFKLKDAYDFLMNYVSVNGSYEKIITDDSPVNKDSLNQSVNQKSYKSTQGAYVEKESWYYYLFVLLIPGAFIPYCGIMLILVFYFMVTEEKKKKDGFAIYLIIVIPQFLLIMFACLAGVYSIFQYALEGRIVHQVILIQMALLFIYFGVCYLYRKYLELKYLRNSALSTM
jgi:hypothetical protein